MKRIIIIGSSGAGKSTFSYRLSKILKLPVYHLDMIWWNKDKTHISREEFDAKLKEIVNTDSWIIDGDYSRTYDIRFEACDTVFFLDYSLEECLKGIEARIGVERPDIPWIEEQFDQDFKEWIINWHKEQLPKTYEYIEKYKNKKNITIFKNREEAMLFLNNYKENL